MPKYQLKLEGRGWSLQWKWVVKDPSHFQLERAWVKPERERLSLMNFHKRERTCLRTINRFPSLPYTDKKK